MDESTRLAELSGELSRLVSKLKAQHKLLKNLQTGRKDGDLPRALKALTGLDGALLERVGLGPGCRAVQDESRQALDSARQEQRRELGRTLLQAAEQAGRSCRKLSENPLEFLVAPFTVEIALETMEATVLFAREPLAQVPAKAERIMDAVRREEKGLADRKVTPEGIFDSLLRAYRSLLGATMRPAGERVALADVLPYMALMQQSARFESDPRRERFVTYPKSHFLFDLATLRRARLLERNGWRLDLGTATGDSVKRKSMVFFLQNNDGQGQYYLSLRFVQSGRLL